MVDVPGRPALLCEKEGWTWGRRLEEGERREIATGIIYERRIKRKKKKQEPEGMEDIHGSRPSKHSRVGTRDLTETVAERKGMDLDRRGGKKILGESWEGYIMWKKSIFNKRKNN